MKKTEKIIIIGGGISGLSAGIYAQLAGFKAEIYEKNSVPGGECMGWNREGYHIDNCIHWLTGTKKGTELYDVWKTVGAISENTKFVGLKSFYTSCLNGKKATLWADLERTRRELTELSPKDKDEIDKFIEYVEYSKQCQVPAEKPMDMFGIGDYIRYGKSMGDFVKVIKELGNISLEEYSKRFKSPLLQKLFCDYLPKEYTAYSLLVSYASIADGNGDIPMGASLEMSLRMEKRFKDLGGKIFYNKTVDKILLRGKKAEAMLLSDGRRVEGDYFIATVDTSILFGKMLDKKYMPKALQKAYASTKDYPAVSGFQVAYTADKDFNPGETVFIDIEPLKVGGRTVDRMYVKVYGYDPKFVKDGKQVIQTNIVQSDDDYAFWKSLSKEEYKRVKEELVLAVTKRIEAEYPMLKGKLHCLDSWTPLTYERYCNAYHGSYMSFITTPTGKQVRLKGNIGRIRNLCFAGQWNSAPGGLPVAVTNGKFAIQRICKTKDFLKAETMTREEQKEERKKAILMTALTLFVEKGYHETKVADIAAAVPMSTGLMFHYFKSKEELLMALVVMGKEFTKATAGGDNIPPDVFLKGMLDELFLYAQKDPFVANMFVLMAQARRAGMPEDVRKVAMSVSSVDDTAKLIKKGQKEGIFRKGNPKLLALCFWSAFQGIMEEMTIDKKLGVPDSEWLLSILKGN